jgi:hypothetical protein
MTTFNTMLLDLTTWDLVVDAAGNIAVASPPYALAQDVATAAKTNQGECWYNATIGVPYQYILGVLPSMSFLQNSYISAALSVPGVVSATCFFEQVGIQRDLIGEIRFVDENNISSAVAI